MFCTFWILAYSFAIQLYTIIIIIIIIITIIITIIIIIIIIIIIKSAWTQAYTHN
jgi:hypothetical protein